MKIILCFLLLSGLCLSPIFGKAKNDTNPLASFSKAWEDPRYLKCNTGAHTGYLSEKEKEIIYILNMARMNPPLFCKTVLLHAREISFIDTSSTIYYKSLASLMKYMAPLDILMPDSLCYQSAHCHAVSSSKKGYVGHERQTEECKRLQKFSAECCQYGSTTPLDIVLSLLVDQGVPDLGHRKICLGNYSKMSPAYEVHKMYGIVAVLDFNY